jgi:ribosomal protein L37AE/L43A
MPAIPDRSSLDETRFETVPAPIWYPNTVDMTFQSALGSGSPTKPLCPSCNEKLAHAEYGVEGIWACFYCQGVWVPNSNEARIHLRKPELSTVPEHVSTECRELNCPVCGQKTFEKVSADGASGYRCENTCGIFFEPEAIEIIPSKELSEAQNMVGYAILEMAATLLIGSVIGS